VVAILPELSVGGAQVMNEEAPGLSLEKLTPRIQDTARALWKIYRRSRPSASGSYGNRRFP
jgi:trk system potassium uptake protein TrkH